RRSTAFGRRFTFRGRLRDERGVTPQQCTRFSHSLVAGGRWQNAVDQGKRPDNRASGEPTIILSVRSRCLGRSLVVAVALLAVAARAAPSELGDDLSARRARVMERLGPDALVILWSASPKVYSGDVNYEYRQESNFFYLTGVTAEDAILVLMPGNAKQ